MVSSIIAWRSGRQQATFEVPTGALHDRGAGHGLPRRVKNVATVVTIVVIAIAIVVVKGGFVGLVIIIVVVIVVVDRVIFNDGVCGFQGYSFTLQKAL